MDITIHMTKATAKRILIVSSALIVLGTTAAVFAVPVTFQAGTLLKSADLNKDFAAATTATAGTKSYSLGAVFKEATTQAYTGNIGGYATAKTLCEAAVGTPTAHMCTTEEILRSAQLGITGMSGAWYASGTSVVSGSSAGTNNDCAGWTDANTALSGPRWGGTGAGEPAPLTCDNSARIACCD